MRTGLWDRQGANIASRYKPMLLNVFKSKNNFLTLVY